MLTFSRTEYPIYSVFLLRNFDTQRIYQLNDFAKAQLVSRPSWPAALRARIKIVGRLNVVIESVQLDIQHAEFSTIPVHVDGAGGSAIF